MTQPDAQRVISNITADLTDLVQAKNSHLAVANRHEDQPRVNRLLAEINTLQTAIRTVNRHAATLVERRHRIAKETATP